ncbi:hypothetical protein [Rhizobium phaseoli]|uniref:hypothetical protein n=1 Tax=Rhizobium phaseoli TaxID=396 RepID=UPI000BE7A63A|nr:hypothetical protein [Rhizobium phaseoli]MDK4726461.1 hypothetical protein [Rhizobium phaseoli]NKE89944.1 hypothetical protein [Rhizobium phaseoli]PDS69010.1 hypothetical protein CO651_26165 [Rhizobium phaseoli]
MANLTAIKANPKTAAAKTDRDPVYRAAVSELKTLRVAIEQSTGKWSLTNEKSAHTVNHKVK